MVGLAPVHPVPAHARLGESRVAGVEEHGRCRRVAARMEGLS